MIVSSCLGKTTIRGDEPLQHRHNKLDGIGQVLAPLTGPPHGIDDYIAGKRAPQQ